MKAPLASGTNRSSIVNDPVLAELADELAHRLQSGEPFDVEAFLAEHPQQAGALRVLLPSLELFSLMGPETADSAAAAVELGDAEHIRGVLGDYRLVREIGRGGMGVVYEALHMTLSRRVALKVLPFAGALDSRQLARFKHEALAAAQLEHPHIVDVHGIGCERGVHFYVMRFIEGPSLAQVIDELKAADERSQKSEVRSQKDGTRDLEHDECKMQIAKCKLQVDAGGREVTTQDLPPNPKSKIQNRKSTIAGLATTSGADGRAYFRAVAELAIAAAEALHYAHEHGIVHRDVKPANLMIDAHGKLWVTDFGLAQIESAASLTLPGDLLGTLRYMSPEQALAKRVAIDYRTDIYSLGATLYELATLEPVFSASDKQELLRQLAFDEPRALRKVRRSVPREIETIVLKALEKNPADRYQSAQDFADDLRRFLAEEPIRARPPGIAARTVKWSRRHKATVAVLGAVAVLLALCGPAVAWREAHLRGIAETRRLAAEKAQGAAEQAEDQERAQREVAEERLDIAHQAVDEYLNRVTEDPDLKRSDFNPLRKKLLEAALPFFQRLAEQKPGDTAGEAERGKAFGRLGSVRQEMGENKEAEANFREERAIFAQLVRDFPTVPEYRKELASTHNNLGRLLNSLDRRDDAEGEFRAALSLMQQLVVDFPDVASYRHGLAMSQNNLGTVLRQLRRYDEAKAAQQMALATQEKLVANFPQEPEYRQALAGSQNNVAILLAYAGQQGKAETIFRDALSTHDKLVADFPTVPQYRRDLAASHLNLANVLHELGRREEAESAYRDALAVREKLAADFPTSPEFREELRVSYHSLGNLLRQNGHYEKAATAYATALGIAEKLSSDYPMVPRYKHGLAGLHNAHGILVAALGKREDAEADHRAAIDLEERLTVDFPTDPEYRRERARGFFFLGLLLDTTRREEAEVAYRAALAIQEELTADFPANSVHVVDLGAVYCNLANLLRDSDRPSEALDYYGQCVRFLSAALERDGKAVQALQILLTVLKSRARLLEKLNRYVDAADDWQRQAELVQGPTCPLRIARAGCFARAGDHARAMLEVNELAQDSDVTAADLYNLACVGSLAAGSVVATDDNRGGHALRDEYALRAVELLRQSIAKGLADVGHIAKDTDLDAVRERDDFKQLVAELEARK